MLEVQCQIYARAEKWDACVEAGWALIKAAPERAAGWIHRSFALHALKRSDEAYQKLVRVADRFPDVWTVPYNLACYCAHLGRHDEAQEWLKKAVAVDCKEVLKSGIYDPDLKPLWDSIIF